MREYSIKKSSESNRRMYPGSITIDRLIYVNSSAIFIIRIIPHVITVQFLSSYCHICIFNYLEIIWCQLFVNETHIQLFVNQIITSRQWRNYHEIFEDIPTCDHDPILSNKSRESLWQAIIRKNALKFGRRI